MNRLLIVYPGAMGDVLLTRPILQLLRTRIPEITIDFAGNPACFTLLPGDVEQCFDFSSTRFLPLFTEKQSFSPEVTAFFRTYDLTVVWLGRETNPTEITESVKAGLNLFAAPALPPDTWRRHISEWLLNTLREKIPALRGCSLPDIRPLPACSEPVGNQIRNPYFVVHPGSGSPSKNLPPPFYLELAKRLEHMWHLRPVFVLGPAEQGIESVFQEEKDAVIKPPSLSTLKALLEGARFYIGNDSGVTHLAAQTGIPTVALFVSTDPHIWHPLGPEWLVLHRRPKESSHGRIVLIHSWSTAEITEEISRFLDKAKGS